ncbi:MAG: hypothetical protein JNM09_06515 [Blastocatellia bacterium]|nr:hypothetical protein [Blastocatellia bacterium]
MTDERLTLAYQLAYFIHGDPIIAKRIAFAALEKLETAILAQDKRLYYSGKRNKVSMPELHLLQRLVYAESEGEERRREQQGAINERALLKHFIKHLVKLTVRRNSLHVAVGLSRLLHHYTTAEAMALYSLILQDPARVAAEDYFRSRKKMLLAELKTRFGDLLATTRGPRGEERFVTHEQPQPFIALVRECLLAFTPWRTPCPLPERFDLANGNAPPLSFTGSDPDEEHAIEINRMHALLHPPCLANLTDVLQQAAPDEQLAIPRFFMTSRHDDNSPDDDTPPRRDAALDEAAQQDLQQHLQDRARRRKFSPAGLLLFVADGHIVAQLDLHEACASQFSLPANTEFLEVRTRDDEGEFVLATCPLQYNEDDQVVSQQQQFTLEGGQQIALTFSPAPNGTEVAFTYHETKLPRALRLLWQQQRFGVSWWKPALLVALFALLLGGISFFFWQPQPRPQMVKQTSPTVAPVPSVTSSPSATPSPSPSVIAPTPARPDDNVIARDIRARATSPTESLTRGERESGVEALLTGQKLYLEVSGGEPMRQTLTTALQQRLQANGKLQLTAAPEAAEVALKVTIQSNAKAERITVLARIVNADGKVIWPLTPNTRGREYVGFRENVAATLTRDLVREFGQMRRNRK